MRTMVLDISVPRIVLTRILGRYWKGAYFGFASPLHLVHLADPPLPASDWVRVRNCLCGICGSDLHQVFVDAGLDVAPVALPSHQRIYLGHEMVGEVVEVDEMAILTEPAAVAIHAAWRRRAKAGEQVLVLGCGTIGYLLIQAVRTCQPACEISAVAQFPWQAEMALAYGADHVFLSSDDGFAEVARLTGARLYEGRAANRMLMGGFDMVFDKVVFEL